MATEQSKLYSMNLKAYAKVKKKKKTISGEKKKLVWEDKYLAGFFPIL